MALELIKENGGRIIEVRVSKKLSKADYEHFVPEVERLIEQFGKIRVLFTMHDFHGWDAGALWEDIKFDVKHFSDIDRIAFVGEKQWEKGMSIFCRPFTTAQIRYFDAVESEQASEWIKSE
jgi:hypothetical protein